MGKVDLEKGLFILMDVLEKVFNYVYVYFGVYMVYIFLGILGLMLVVEVFV